MERLVLPLSEVTARIEKAVWQAIQALIERRPTDGTDQPLLTATPLVVGLTLLLAYSPLAPFLGFVPLPASFLVVMGFDRAALRVKLRKRRNPSSTAWKERRRETGPAVISARLIGVSR